MTAYKISIHVLRGLTFIDFNISVIVIPPGTHETSRLSGSLFTTLTRSFSSPLTILYVNCHIRLNPLFISNNNPVAIITTTQTSKKHCIKTSPGINENNKMHFINKYSILGWSHDPVRKKNSYDDSQMLQKFIEVVESQAKYNNKERGSVKALPIVILHDIANDRKDAYTATSIELFESEMKYLYDNDFTVITMGDLLYDEISNSLKIKEIYLQ